MDPDTLLTSSQAARALGIGTPRLCYYENHRALSPDEVKTDGKRPIKKFKVSTIEKLAKNIGITPNWDNVQKIRKPIHKPKPIQDNSDLLSTMSYVVLAGKRYINRNLYLYENVQELDIEEAKSISKNTGCDIYQICLRRL